jgi:hypothetical protein
MTGAISTIRQFTSDDDAALTKAALSFADRHFSNGLTLDIDDRPWQALDAELWSRPDTCSDTKRLRRLWQACRCRALGLPVSADITVAYGCIGRRVK